MENNEIQHNQENTVMFDKFQYAVVAIEERLNIKLEWDFIKVQNCHKDISSKFKGVPQEKIFEAIKKGSLGEYGRTYRLSTQEICIWIREYLKEEKSNKFNPNDYI